MHFEAFISETYVQLVATSATVLRAQAFHSETSYCYDSYLNTTAATASVTVSRTVLCGALYTACVDASRTVFRDRSVLC